LTPTDELLRLPGGEGQRVVVFHAEPGSPSDAALRLLANLTLNLDRHADSDPAKPHSRWIDLISLAALLP
jgi:hypothetical protein